MHPMFLPKTTRSFSLYKIFESQIVSRKNLKFPKQGRMMNGGKKLIDGTVDERQRNNFRVYAHALLGCVEDHGGDLTLKYILRQLKIHLT